MEDFRITTNEIESLTMMTTTNKTTNPIKLSGVDMKPIKNFWDEYNNFISYHQMPKKTYLGTFKNYEICQIEIVPYILINIPVIIKAEMLNPVVMRFTFSDGKIIKTVCGREDTFNFEFSFYLAYAKYLFKDFLTPQGIELKAKEFMYNKGINKLVKKGIKIYEKQIKEEDKIAKEKAIKEAARKNKIAKKKAKKAKAKEARVAEIAEAIKRTR